MAQKEIWFTCPLCARPIRVSGKFIGAEFVHPACGATVLAPDPAQGRAESELIAEPDISVGGDVKKVKLEKFESQGLFVPRRLREGGGEDGIPEAAAEVPVADDDVHDLAEKIARALLEKQGAAVEVPHGDEEDPEAGEILDLDFDGVFGVEAPDDRAPPIPVKPPLSEKASVLGSGRAPVDPDALKRQFSKSLDTLKGDAAAAAEVGMLEGKAPLSAQRQDLVVKSVTPWEADDGGEAGADAGVPAPVPQHGGSRPVFLVVGIVVLVICALLVTRSLTKRDTNKDDPSDVPIRGTIRD